MPRRKKVFFNPKFNEWLYDQLVNLKAEQTKNLSYSELRFIRNSKAIKQFVHNENLEKVLSLCTKLGIQWSLTFFGMLDKLDAKLVEKTYKQYAFTGKSVENIDEMLRHKIFVIHAREVALSMSLMSLNCHSDVYMLNPFFTGFKQTMSANISIKKKWAESNHNIQYRDVSRETINMTKLVLNAKRVDDYVTGVLNLQMLDIMILWLLYTTPQNFVSVENLKRELRSQYKPASVGSRAAYLFRERKMIEKRPSSEKIPSYIIAQEGIITVGMINNHLLNSVYGN